MSEIKTDVNKPNISHSNPKTFVFFLWIKYLVQRDQYLHHHHRRQLQQQQRLVLLLQQLVLQLHQLLELVSKMASERRDFLWTKKINHRPNLEKFLPALYFIQNARELWNFSNVFICIIFISLKNRFLREQFFLLWRKYKRNFKFRDMKKLYSLPLADSIGFEAANAMMINISNNSIKNVNFILFDYLFFSSFSKNF